jgi:hypothetical protein
MTVTFFVDFYFSSNRFGLGIRTREADDLEWEFSSEKFSAIPPDELFCYLFILDTLNNFQVTGNIIDLRDIV